MPLLRKQPFQPEKPPPDIKPDEEVFYCKLTREIFRDYEKFFEKIILCNSLVWSCSITGRSGLTFQEAEESEEKALKQLAAFPTYLQKPILFLGSITQRSRIADLNDDVFTFAKDRFFMGECLDLTTGQSKIPCKVVGIIPPPGTTPTSPMVNGGTEKSPDKKKSANKPERYQYVIQEQGKVGTTTVKFKMLSRKKGLYTRDKSKLFLKQNCDNVDGIWRVKQSKIKKLKIDQMSFDDVFAGPQPTFEFSEMKLKKPPKKVEPKESSPAPSNKTGDIGGGQATNNMTIAEIQAMREKDRILKEKDREEKMLQKMKEKEEIRRKFEEEREKKKKERAMEIEKKREERQIQAELWRAWRQTRDDLDCDDLKVLPEPTPVKCRIPAESFGDAVMVIEFVNCFNNIFDLKASFPKGFDLAILEEALLETDAGGLMADLLLMMITAVFSLQEEEEEEQAHLSKQEKEQVSQPFPSVSNLTISQMIDAASKMSQLPLLVHGLPLTKLPLDNFTLTEILRLHIMASGAQGNQANAKFRYQQRGGYMPIDDAGLDFKMQESDIIGKLAVENIYDFNPGQKLKVLKLLVDQFLTYAATRDALEDNYDKLRNMKIDLKQFQWGEQRREREEAANRYKAKLEEKQKERDILEKKRLLKMKQREDQVKKEECERTGEEFQQSKIFDNTGTQISEEELQKQIDELEAALPSVENREEQQKMEDDDEADKKAEYMRKEREFLENIMDLQHGNAIYPIGRDRLYRRYWMFKSVPGIFVEDDDENVSEAALIPISQNPDGSTFDLLDPFMILPKMRNVNKQCEQEKVSEVKDGSDKENESGTANDTTGGDVNNSSQNTSDSSSVVPAKVSATENILMDKTDDKITNGDEMIVISDDENSKDKPSEFVETEAIKQINARNANKVHWGFYKTQEDIDCLIDSLNGRGERESVLKSVLLEQKNKINETVTEVQSDLLHIPDESDSKEDLASSKTKTKEWRRGRRNVTGTVKNDSAHEGLELNLRELILDLEERIHVGSLGYLKIKDRTAWRDAIENGSYEPNNEDPMFIPTKSPVKAARVQNGAETDNDTADVVSPTVAISKDMAKALIQIARGIDAKYLQPPLGDEKSRMARLKTDMQKKGKKTEKDGNDDSDDEEIPSKSTQTLLEKWEDSCMQSTSLAQVFLHLSTLEKSVTWAKSLLHTRCTICRRKCDPEKLLLCDGCDKGHHIYCLKPALKHIPKQDWYCPNCRPKETKRSPRKERRRTFSEQPSDDEEEEEMETEEQNEEEEMAEDEESGGEEDLDSMCAVCSKTGTLVCCDVCPLMYHLTCAQPQLKKVPRGKWLCQICNGTDLKAGKIKMNLGKGKSDKGKKKTSPKTTPNSSRLSSKRGSPRDSPLTIKPVKKRKREESPVVEKTQSKLTKNARSASKLSLDNKADDIKHYTSSSRGNTKVLQLKLLEEVVMGLIDEDDAWPFLRPVAKKDAPDYYELIKKPMDFQTIKNKIKKFEYGDPAEIVEDVRLIFANCIEYNKRTTQEFKAGASMSKLFERKLKNLSETQVSNGPSSKKARTK